MDWDGFSKDQRWLLIHIYASVPGEGVYQALPLLFAFACDIVLPFPEKGKKKAWETWAVFQRLHCTFLAILCLKHLVR